jgi:hypothetical protein
LKQNGRNAACALLAAERKMVSTLVAQYHTFVISIHSIYFQFPVSIVPCLRIVFNKPYETHSGSPFLNEVKLLKGCQCRIPHRIISMLVNLTRFWLRRPFFSSIKNTSIFQQWFPSMEIGEW